MDKRTWKFFLIQIFVVFGYIFIICWLRLLSAYGVGMMSVNRVISLWISLIKTMNEQSVQNNNNQKSRNPFRLSCLVGTYSLMYHFQRASADNKIISIILLSSVLLTRQLVCTGEYTLHKSTKHKNFLSQNSGFKHCLMNRVYL